jgi:hypothetical protein
MIASGDEKKMKKKRRVREAHQTVRFIPGSYSRA